MGAQVLTNILCVRVYVCVRVCVCARARAARGAVFDTHRYLSLCSRVAQSAFLGVPADEQDEPCSHIIMDLGARQVRIGANTDEFTEPIVVDCPTNCSLEDKVRLAAQRLMGSSRYVRLVHPQTVWFLVWFLSFVTHGCSFPNASSWVWMGGACSRRVAVTAGS